LISDNTVASDVVTIDAPAEFVWDILVDFDTYGEWNGFCPSVKNTSLSLGSAVDMMVDLGDGPSQQVEYICRVEPNECIAWGMDNKPDDPVHAVRSQYIKRVDDKSCTYLSVDEFAGPEVKAMMDAFAKPVEAGFNRCAYDLKAHAEKLYRS
jgi:uncharacterized protein YndB with AHSA1/START domain